MLRVIHYNIKYSHTRTWYGHGAHNIRSDPFKRPLFCIILYLSMITEVNHSVYDTYTVCMRTG